jgi:putative PEP-CTERM system TPR-repeat lipoprotein
MTRRYPFARPTILLAMALGVLLGAAVPAFARDYLAESKVLLQKGDLRGAQIALRNAVRDEPKNGEAHFRLAGVHLTLGDAAGAEKEARLARENGYDARQSIAILAQAMLAQGRFRPLLDELKPEGKDAAIDAEILLAHAQANAGLRNMDAARALLSEAERTAPESPAGLNAALQLALIRNDTAEVARKVDQLLAKDPSSLQALLRKAQLLRAAGKTDDALAMLEKAVAAHPEQPTIRLERAQLLLAGGQDAKAQEEINFVLTATPNNVPALYMQAGLMARAKDYKGADAIFQRISNAMASIPRSFYLLAIVKQNLGQTQLAVEAAQKYVSRVPNDPDGAKLLARLYLQGRQFNEAVEVLSRLANTNSQDAQIFDLLGQAYTAAGKGDQAIQAFQRATTLAPDDAGARTRLAGARMGAGQPGEAATDLERSLQLAPTSTGIGEALFFAELATGDLSKAAAALEQVRKAQGETPVVMNIEGVLRMAQRDFARARAMFEKAIATQADFTPGQVNLARLNIMESRDPEADKLLSAVLAREADSEPALTIQIGSLVRRNELTPAIVLAERALAAKPTSIRPRLLLAELYVRNKDMPKALSILAPVSGVAPNAELLAARARVQMASGENNMARDTFTQALELEPRALQTRRQLVNLLAGAGDVERARSVIEAGLRIDPRDYTLMEDYIALDLRSSGIDTALATAERLRRQTTDFPPTRALRGDVYVAARQLDQALDAYAKEMQAEPLGFIAQRMAALYSATGKPDLALKTLRDWLAKNPSDLGVMQMLAGLEIGAARYDDAEVHLQELLTKNPRDGATLNNLAWVYQKRGDRRARGMAERAYLLLPSAQTADTLGWILV